MLGNESEVSPLHGVDPNASPEERRKRVAINMRLAGKSLAEVSDRTGLTEQEVHRAEAAYYESQETLSEHAMLIKQLTRLDRLLSLLWERVEGRYVENPDEFRNILDVLKEISELAGLRKQRLQAEVRIIQQDQVPLIQAYVRGVLSAYEEHLAPLLTVRGTKALEAKRDEWVVDATSQGVAQLTEKTTTLRA